MSTSKIVSPRPGDVDKAHRLLDRYEKRLEATAKAKTTSVWSKHLMLELELRSRLAGLIELGLATERSENRSRLHARR